MQPVYLRKRDAWLVKSRHASIPSAVIHYNSTKSFIEAT
jgi:hypothetical protein